jgi:hypothetical protein
MNRTLAEITDSLSTADVFTWIRGTDPRAGTLSVFHDDIPNDRRTIHEVRFTPHHVTIEKRTLRAYNAKKHQWTEYEGNAQYYQLSSRKGEEALRQTLADYARKEKGVPNPEVFSHYPTKATA